MNVLLLARYFPPMPAGGARRPYLMARALIRSGARVFVCAPNVPSDIPGVVMPHHHPEPAASVTPGELSLARWGIRDWGRELLRWPDPDIGWARAAGRRAAESVPFKPDWIITTSPPESLLPVGLGLKRRFGARWLADFRDTWLLDARRPERNLIWRRLGEATLARRWLKKADRLCAVDNVVATEIGRLSGGRDVVVVPQLVPPPGRRRALEPIDATHIAYTGQISIGDHRRSVDDLIRVFTAARERNPSLVLHICGHLTSREAERLQATEAVRLHGALPLQAVLDLQASADALIVHGSDGSTAVPGKLAEYRATAAPIVAIGSGPWLCNAGLTAQDPVAALAAVSGRAPPPPLPGSDPAAAALLELLGLKVDEGR